MVFVACLEAGRKIVCFAYRSSASPTKTQPFGKGLSSTPDLGKGAVPRAVGNGTHFCDTTERASPKDHFVHRKGGFQQTYHSGWRTPLIDPTTRCRLKSFSGPEGTALGGSRDYPLGVSLRGHFKGLWFSQNHGSSKMR